MLMTSAQLHIAACVNRCMLTCDHVRYFPVLYVCVYFLRYLSTSIKADVDAAHLRASRSLCDS